MLTALVRGALNNVLFKFCSVIFFNKACVECIYLLTVTGPRLKVFEEEGDAKCINGVFVCNLRLVLRGGEAVNRESSGLFNRLFEGLSVVITVGLSFFMET